MILIKRSRNCKHRSPSKEKAIETVKERARHITNVANSLYEMVAAGITSIEDVPAQEILARYNARLTSEKGVSLVVIGDEKIKIDVKSPLQSIASVLFDKAKKQSGAISSIQQVKQKAETRLEKMKNKTEAEKDKILVSGDKKEELV